MLTNRGLEALAVKHVRVGHDREHVDREEADCADPAKETEYEQHREDELACGAGDRSERWRQQRHVVFVLEEAERRLPAADLEQPRLEELPADVDTRGKGKRICKPVEDRGEQGR